MATATDLSTVAKALMDSAAPLDARIRTLYILKDKHRNLEGAKVLAQAVDTTDSVLLQHELLYNVGQFGFSELNAEMKRVVTERERYHEVSRHEAIEAMGAIGDVAVIPFLEAVMADKTETAPIIESCELAIRRLNKKTNEGDDSVGIPKGCTYSSVDPAPAASTKDIAALSVALNDPKEDMFVRYEAMFALRNLNTNEAAMALANSLISDKSSCLFRHEVAFVLGQMENPETEAALIESVRNEEEHGMVRHEAAEALGALAKDSSWAVLKEYANHPEGILRDSCVVALEMFEYWKNFKPSSSE